MSVKKVTLTDKEILERLKNGQTQQSIGEEFGVSRRRILQICDRARLLEENPIDELRELCLKFAGSEHMATSIYRVLHKGDLYYNVPPILTVEDLKNVSITNISRLNHIGVKSLEIIAAMKEYIK